MPMDERTKATVRTLLDRHPRGYVAETAGFPVTDTAAGLFRLLIVSILADDGAPSRSAVDGTRALLDRGWHSAFEMAKSGDRERADVLAGAGYGRAGEASRLLGEATRLVLDRYEGDLRRLREAADGDARSLRRLLAEIPGMDDAGQTVFLREAQMFWPEAGPFVDARAAGAAERLGLPSDARDLLDDVARGGGEEELSWLVGALALADVNDEYDGIRRKAEAAAR